MKEVKVIIPKDATVESLKVVLIDLQNQINEALKELQTK